MSPSTLSSMTHSAPRHKKREFWRLGKSQAARGGDFDACAPKAHFACKARVSGASSRSDASACARLTVTGLAHRVRVPRMIARL